MIPPVPYRARRAGKRSLWYAAKMINVRSELPVGLAGPPGAAPVAWRVQADLVPYPDAVAFMEARAAAIAAGREGELAWLVEHSPLYTAGTSARREDVLEARFPVFESSRGGQMTYHGPGQRVAYLMLDLKRRGPDGRRYVATFEDKIAAIGIRVTRWVTLHGMALNITPDLSHFAGIVPCGVSVQRYGVTSLADLGIAASMAEVDHVLRQEFERLFGATVNQAVGSTENNSPARRDLQSAASPSR